MTSFRVGFTVPGGEPVDIEARHLGITGMTQASGKTTALEAFMDRADETAIAFRTSRGELGFHGVKRIGPYFRERTDWRFVEGLISAHLMEKAKFYRGDLIRLTRGTHGLSEVHANIRKALAAARAGSFQEKIYTELNEYITEIRDALESVRFDPAPNLTPGRLSVMDLEALTPAVQQLVIAATVDWLMEGHLTVPVIVVLPEARDFIPEDRRTPAKLALENLIRKGARVSRYLWLDSQALTGLDMDVCRSIGTWFFGNQSLDLEIRRVGKMVPGRKVKADDVRGLALGQFLLVQGEDVRKVYVQPAWLPEACAYDVAIGKTGYAEPQIQRFKSKLKEEDVDEKERKEYEDRIKGLEADREAGREAVHRLSLQITELRAALKKEYDRAEVNAKAAADNAIERVHRSGPVPPGTTIQTASTVDGKTTTSTSEVPPGPVTGVTDFDPAAWFSTRERIDLHVMNTQVREAVEILLQELDDSLQASPAARDAILAPLSRLNLTHSDQLRVLYQAAIRFVMRLVTALYAESRDLFPKSNPIYFGSYSVETLFHDLSRARLSEGDDALESVVSAWPRLQSLFRLIHEGSHHPELTLPAYKGELFRPPGTTDTDEAAVATLALYQREVRVSDLAILRILEKLKVGRFRTPGGGWRSGPVDFSDLRTEYIGMMYEGLLDFELRSATESDGGVIVLNLGSQPALPFRVLPQAGQGEERIRRFIKNVAKKRGTIGPTFVEEPAADDIEADQTDDSEALPANVDGASLDDEVSRSPLERSVHDWAKWVVGVTEVNLPPKRVMDSWDPSRRELEVDRAAQKLVLRVIPPGGTYLIHWTGNRKGSGTFYTKPGLAIPTVRRALEPLIYMISDGKRVPRRPDEILRIKICDPAMGSGSFLVASLNFLTEALVESFETHVFPGLAKGQPLTLTGNPALGLLNERILQLHSGEMDSASERIEAQLKRAVVEHSIYGVDVNPLAVELGKLALWIETMDPTLNFTFLDHKVKCGDSLVGSWLHEYSHYPLNAWLRDGGDDKEGPRTAAIRSAISETVRPQLAEYVQSARRPGETSLLPGAEPTPASRLTRAREVLQKMHIAPDESEREEIYHSQIIQDEGLARLRYLMDRWCAIWYWPISTTRSDAIGPETFYLEKETESQRAMVARIAAAHRFFHWELEFPDVFTPESWGFDVVVGNPPWNAVTPDNVAFFARYSPEYGLLDKTGKDRLEKELFEDNPQIQEEHWDYVAAFRAFDNYVKHARDPFTPEGREAKLPEVLQRRWAALVHTPGAHFPQAHEPYRLQYLDANWYKLFAERLLFLTRPAGRFAFIAPDGFYSQESTKPIRAELLLHNQWQWLYSFENRNRIFPIDSRWKFCVVIGSRGGQTTSVHSRFMERVLDSWNKEADPPHMEYGIDQLQLLSPEYLVFVEFENPRDLEIFSRMHRNGITLATALQEGNFGREFNANDDVKLLRARSIPEPPGAPRKWVPLYQGAMIHQFDFAYQGFDDSHRTYPIPFKAKTIEPGYFMDEQEFDRQGEKTGPVRLVYRRQAPATNRRTMIAALIPRAPCNESLFMLKSRLSFKDTLRVAAVLNSYAFDYALRLRHAGSNVSWFVLAEMPVPRLGDIPDSVAQLVLKLNWHPRYFPDIKGLDTGLQPETYETDELVRAKIREEIDAEIARCYGLTDDDMRWILRSTGTNAKSLWKDYADRLASLGGPGKWGELTSPQNLSPSSPPKKSRRVSGKKTVL